MSIFLCVSKTQDSNIEMGLNCKEIILSFQTVLEEWSLVLFIKQMYYIVAYN